MTDNYWANTSSTDAYRDWDAAYLLGSLAPTERREYETHLAGCPECSASVAELAALPGLLSRVSLDDIDQQAVRPDVPATLLPRLVTATRRHRLRVRTMATGLVVAVAAAAVVVTLVIPQLVPADAGHQVAELTLSQVVSSPLHADIRLVEHDWGTSIDMNCQYTSASPAYDGRGTAYAMYVTDASGTATQLATWTARPGTTVEPSGTTSLALAEIRSVDVRSVDTGEVLLAGNP